MVISSFAGDAQFSDLNPSKNETSLFKMFRVCVSNKLSNLVLFWWGKYQLNEAGGNLLSLCMNFANKIVPTCSWVVVHVLQTMQNLVISRCCFAEVGKEMYQDSKRTCTAIVLLINPFVLMTFPLPLPSWFRKLPNVRGQISEHIFAPNGDYGLFIPWSTKLASVCVTFWAFFLLWS